MDFTHTYHEDRQNNITTIVACGIMIFFILALALWMTIDLNLPLIYPAMGFLLVAILLCGIYTTTRLWEKRRQQRKSQEFHQKIFPQRLPINPYASIYGTFTENTSYSTINDDRFRQLNTLRQKEKTLRIELEELDIKARAAYATHTKASQYMCSHDIHKMESTCQKLSDGFKDASQAWYAADSARTKKKKELRKLEQDIKDLRSEMGEHFSDIV